MNGLRSMRGTVTTDDGIVVELRGKALTAIGLGRWAINRYRRLQGQNGTYKAAQRMRKDGCPLELALRVLT